MGKEAAFVVLGLPENAQSIEITRAFRDLSRRTHPDVGGDPLRFASIVAAYRSLQRAGLVDRDQPKASAPSLADTYYRRLLRQLDQAATRLESATRTRSLTRPSAPFAPAPTGESFTAILDRELRRVS